MGLFIFIFLFTRQPPRPPEFVISILRSAAFVGSGSVLPDLAASGRRRQLESVAIVTQFVAFLDAPMP